MSSKPEKVHAQGSASLEGVEHISSIRSSNWSPFVFDSTAQLAPEQPIYEGLLSKGDLVIWLGREKHRKSNVLLQFSICAALGRPFLHFRFCPEKPMKVVILDYESKTESLKRRYDAITTAMGLDQTELQILKTNLRIVEMRKAFRDGVEFARFPVKKEKSPTEENMLAEKQWRSFVREMAADLYVIDPMRCMHAHAENDSAIEALLSRVHQMFGDATVVISHHLRKRNRKKADQVSLRDDMRAWADEARGSGAITAHADVIVCQERTVASGLEKLDFGAYLRDGADIEPMSVRETGFESFLWEVAPDIPLELTLCLDALKQSAEEFPNRAAAVAVLEQVVGCGRSTAYSRLKELSNRGLLVADNDGRLRVSKTMDSPAKP
jgi:AAA domain-containing protein